MVNEREARKQFSRLLKRVQLGEETVIGKAGKPVARLVPRGAAAAMRRPGSAKGRLKIHGDFDAPLCKDLSEAFGL